jgi:hypothetical protein
VRPLQQLRESAKQQKGHNMRNFILASLILPALLTGCHRDDDDKGDEVAECLTDTSGADTATVDPVVTSGSDTADTAVDPVDTADTAPTDTADTSVPVDTGTDTGTSDTGATDTGATDTGTGTDTSAG